MKCITNGHEIRRVSDLEAEHYISMEGWEYCQKKIKAERFVCSKCGKKFIEKPERCIGSVVKNQKDKEGNVFKKKVPCGGKVFNKLTVDVPAWN